MQTYTQDNAKLVRAFCEAVNSGQFDRARNLLDPNVEWNEPNTPGLWFRGVHRGPDAVFKEIMEPISGKVADFRVDIEQTFNVGDHVIAIARFYGRGTTTGKQLNTQAALVSTWRNGKVIRFEAFHDEATWLQVLGQPQVEAQRIAA